jgi:hypothetical protein
VCRSCDGGFGSGLGENFLKVLDKYFKEVHHIFNAQDKHYKRFYIS